MIGKLVLSSILSLFLFSHVTANEKGKINLEYFPATAQTECQFMEDSTVNQTYTSFSGRVQSNGIWLINSEQYKILDKMTFNYSGRTNYRGSTTTKTELTSVTFMNAHGELVTTKNIKGHLLEFGNLSDALKLSTREIDGKPVKFMPRGKRCVLVLSQPLNLNLRK